MSGGSWDCLCFDDIDKLCDREDNIQAMADRLASDNLPLAAKETQELLATLRMFKNRISVLKERLEPVWRAVEWCDSCDTTHKDYIEIVEEHYKKLMEGVRS